MRKSLRNIDLGNLFVWTFEFPEIESFDNRIDGYNELVSSDTIMKQSLRTVISNEKEPNTRRLSDYIRKYYKKLVPLCCDSLQSKKYHAVSFSMMCMNCASSEGVPRKVAFAFHFSIVKEIDLMKSEENLCNLMCDLPLLYRELVKVFAIPRNYSKRVRDAIAIITCSINKRISLEILCDKLYVSKGTLTKAFKKETGLSVGGYIDRIKISVSKVLLLYSEKTIDNISEFLSFSSIQHFSSYFKKNVGITPSQYRSNGRKNL